MNLYFDKGSFRAQVQKTTNQWLWGSLGSLAPYLIGIIIIPGSLAPPISMVRL